jgi:23S rRNA (uridine2552-2'-O)-methyltransferase
MKSKDWLSRQKNDYYVRKSIKEGYFSRAAYKLIEIDKKFKLIANSKSILEIGSSPGGWSQVVFEINPKTRMYAFDILDMKYNNPNLTFIKENFIKFDHSKLPYKFDLIISDIAPNTTGHQSTDHLRIASMIEDIISVVDKISLPSSSFIFKIWKGTEESDIIETLKKKYKNISYFKPVSTRSESSEIFIVAKKYMY